MPSIIIPAYNSEKNIYSLAEDLIKIFNENINLIIVNDFSVDGTHEECMKILDKFKKNVSYIRFSKNFGEHNAVMAGLKYSTEDWVIVMDDDYQHPPYEALNLYNFCVKSELDVVYGDYLVKKHNFIRNFFSKISNFSSKFLFNNLSNIYLSSFKCINRNTVNKILKYKGPSPYIDGLIFDCTSKIGSIKTHHNERKIGKSGYNFIKLIKLYANLLFNFSTKPIHIFSILGIVIAFISGIFGISLIFEKINNPTIPLGYTSLFIAIIFFSGIQLVFLGLLGEYIGKILKNVNNANQYSIDYIELSKDK